MREIQCDFEKGIPAGSLGRRSHLAYLTEASIGCGVMCMLVQTVNENTAPRASAQPDRILSFAMRLNIGSVQ